MKDTHALVKLLKWDIAEEISEAIKYSKLTEETITGKLTMSPMMFRQILNKERVPILREIVEIANVLEMDVKIELIGRE